MTNKKSIFKSMLSTTDPISDYKGKQDSFVDSMNSSHHKTAVRPVKDYSVKNRLSGAAKPAKVCY